MFSPRYHLSSAVQSTRGYFICIFRATDPFWLWCATEHFLHYKKMFFYSSDPIKSKYITRLGLQPISQLILICVIIFKESANKW